jgi:diguanylate cyclase (GGDEF)-like protein
MQPATASTPPRSQDPPVHAIPTARWAPGASLGEADRPYRREDLLPRLLPFALAAAVGALAPLWATGTGVRWVALVVGAMVLGAAALVAVLVVPWQRLPAWATLLPPLVYLAAVAMLQAGTQRSTMVFEPLLTLPVFWLALHHSRRHVEVGVGAVIGIVVLSELLQGDALRDWPEELFWPAAAGVLGIAVNNFVARVREQRAELERLARTDPLTGCGNRRAWHEELDHHLALAGRLGHTLTVAMLDLDRFKQWNDEHGHQQGDVLLQELVAAWESLLREVDMLARLGGDEFAVLLPGAGAAAAEAAVERLRAVVPPPLSCSAGITTWNPPEPPRDFIARADQALYTAKRAGRDRGVLLSPAQAELPLQLH